MSCNFFNHNPQKIWGSHLALLSSLLSLLLLAGCAGVHQIPIAIGKRVVKHHSAKSLLEVTVNQLAADIAEVNKTLDFSSELLTAFHSGETTKEFTKQAVLSLHGLDDPQKREQFIKDARANRKTRRSGDTELITVEVNAQTVDLAIAAVTEKQQAIARIIPNIANTTSALQKDVKRIESSRNPLELKRVVGMKNALTKALKLKGEASKAKTKLAKVRTALVNLRQSPELAATSQE